MTERIRVAASGDRSVHLFLNARVIGVLEESSRALGIPIGVLVRSALADRWPEMPTEELEIPVR